MFVFGKLGVLCFLETIVLRFALLPYYWQNKWLNIRGRGRKDQYINICEKENRQKKKIPQKKNSLLSSVGVPVEINIKTASKIIEIPHGLIQNGSGKCSCSSIYSRNCLQCNF